MKKVLILVLIALLTISVFAQNKSELWKNTADSFNNKQYAQTIEYGEKLLGIPDLGDKFKLQTYLLLANSYYVTKSDMNKSYEYALKVIDLAKQLKGNDEPNAKYDKKYIAPALRIQIKVLYKDKDVTKVIEAGNKSVELYEKYDNSRKSLNMVMSLAGRLKKLKKLDEAITILERVDNPEKPNKKLNDVLASWYSKKGNKAKAVQYLEKSYKLRKNSKTAFKLGVMLQKMNVNKAVAYLADAYVMRGEDKDTKAYKLLQHLFYNVKNKGGDKAELDSQFEGVVAAARTRNQ